MKRLISVLLGLCLSSCAVPAPTPEFLPSYWDRAEYRWMADGNTIGSLAVHLDRVHQGDEELFVIQEDSHRKFMGVTADGRMSITCRAEPTADYMGFHLVPQSLTSQAFFSDGAFLSRVEELTFQDGSVTYMSGDQSIELAVLGEVWIEPVLRIMVTTMPRREGARIGMTMVYLDWQTREVHPHQWLVFSGWGWTDVGGRACYLARFDRMEGFNRQATYWVSRENRLMKVTMGKTTELLPER